jgi:hypothetical protein
MNTSFEGSAALVRADVISLLREKRYEEALARLYQARADAPENLELRRSIEQVKDFLIGAYAKRLGGLDQIARPVTSAGPRSPDAILLGRYIDGVTTYGDLAAICPLGRLRTLQVLVEIYAPGTAKLEVEAVPVPLSGEQSRRLEQLNTLRVQDEEELAPETARSVAPPPPERPDEAEFRAAFGRGTAAFIKGQRDEAIAAFEACLALRPADATAEVMLRRARQIFKVTPE